MSSCNALPQIWAINPTITMGCAFKKSCNGGLAVASEALQEIFAEAITSTSVGRDGLGSNGKSSCTDTSAKPGLRRL